MQKEREGGEYCLNHLLHSSETTDTSVLGLAFMSQLCKKFNFGWSKVYHKGKRRPYEKIIGTIAHEIAHNWGANHDQKKGHRLYKPECAYSEIGEFKFSTYTIKKTKIIYFLLKEYIFVSSSMT